MNISHLFHKTKWIFFANKTRSKVTTNVLWQVTDKAVRYGVGLVVGVWIARYFGPDLYGKYSYSLAYVALLGSLATLGLDKIVTKDIVEYPLQSAKILASACFLKLAGSMILCGVACTSALFVKADDSTVRLMIFILSLGTVSQSVTAIDFYYAAKIQAKYSIIAKIIPFLLLAGVKVCLLLSRFTIVQLAMLTAGEYLLASVFLTVFYNRKEAIRRWKISWQYCRSALQQSLPLILSGLMTGVFMKIDQVMLGNMLDDKAVGTYSAAVKISEIWYFLPVIISASVYPVLIEIRKRGDMELYKKRLLTVFRMMNCITIPAALCLTVFSGYIIAILYGSDYAASANIFAIHIWSGVFVFLGTAGSNFYIIEGLQRLVFWRTLVGAAINVGLNFLIIPAFGGMGAAVATLVTTAIVGLLLDAATRSTRLIFRLKLKSFIFVKT